MTPEERLAFEKRRKARNWAIMLTLLGLVLLFYFIAMARFPRSMLG
ncbi:hypothetical protein [Falsiroseomonas oryziterrae]|nr:hypothetical protein [Roseomonas sp. NPKOSM-4]